MEATEMPFLFLFAGRPPPLLPSFMWGVLTKPPFAGWSLYSQVIDPTSVILSLSGFRSFSSKQALKITLLS